MLLQYISDIRLMMYAVRLSKYTAAITLLHNCILHTKVKEPLCFIQYHTSTAQTGLEEQLHAFLNSALEWLVGPRTVLEL